MYDLLDNFKREYIDLLLTDTDSLCYPIKNQDPYEVMKNNKEYFDLSDYAKDHILHDRTSRTPRNTQEIGIKESQIH
jgi:hypothetical protein